MKVIGLIGGMSWESSLLYYRQINEEIKRRKGGFHSAKVILYSVDFDEIEQFQRTGDWDAAGAVLANAARSLASAGADLLVLCTNTMHKVAPAIEQAVPIPLLHIADPTALEIKRCGYLKVGLLGTQFTMEQAFYKDRLSQQHGLTVIVPSPHDQAVVHRVIFEELCLGKLVEASRLEYRRVIAGLVEEGAEAIILGCTEIALLVDATDSAVPLFDTTALHARAATVQALAD